jgi:hypothetical protein
MKPGDKVKAFVQIGLMKKPEWVKGTLVEEGVVNVSGNRLSLEPGNIKLWETLEWKDGTCSELDSFAEENWESLKEHVSEGMKHFFPDVSLRFDDEERIVYACDDGISIGAGVTEIKTIARFKEVPVWMVNEYHTFYYGRMQPPDVDEVCVGESASSWKAARILLDAIWKMRADAFWESEAGV